MSLRKFLLGFILIDFALFSTWVMWQVGYFGIWQAGLESPGSLQILFDLAIACLLICTWMKKDAEQRGINPYPWIVATFAAGTLVPLVYLLIREYKKEPAYTNTLSAI